MPIYVDKDGSRIGMSEWQELQGQEHYRRIRHFLNKTLRVEVIWHGVVRDTNAPPEHWKPFALVVHNIMTKDSDGRPIERKEVKDVDASQDFRTAAEACHSYEDFLVRYSQCEWLPAGVNDEKGQPKMIFVERGNELAPISPDAPSLNRDVNPELEATLNSW